VYLINICVVGFITFLFCLQGEMIRFYDTTKEKPQGH